MNGIIEPGTLCGTLDRVISSKSQAHRLLICAALADSATRLHHVPPSRDAEATCRCLQALGAGLRQDAEDLSVAPIGRSETDIRSHSDSAEKPECAVGAVSCESASPAPAGSGRDVPVLDCGESGSTLRFLLPVAAALGAQCAFTGQGKLSQRPLEPLYSELIAHGAVLSPQGAFPLTCGGKLRPGIYRLAGNVSSQFISGLLLALPLLEKESEIRVSGPLESGPYVDMTLQALESFGVHWEKGVPEDAADSVLFRLPGGQRYRSPGEASVEADWSGAAFFLAAGALSPTGLTVQGLHSCSLQGDREILSLLRAFGAEVSVDGSAVFCRWAPLRGVEIDASNIPDLVPVLAAVAAHARGDTRIRGIRRLRLKESDRVVSVLAMIRGLGGEAEAGENEIVIHGKGGLPGGRVDAFRDHRIVMAAAVAASRADGPSEIQGIEAADKSYPGFFDRWQALGGAVRLEEDRV